MAAPTRAPASRSGHSEPSSRKPNGIHRVETLPRPRSDAPSELAAIRKPHLLQSARRSTLIRYGVAIATVLAVTVLRLPLAPLLGNSVPFILYFPAVVIAGWFGGFGPGVIATLLSGYCAKTWFFEPTGTFTITDWGSGFRLFVFLASGLLIGFLCGQLQRQTARLGVERDRLEAKVHERTQHLERALNDMEAFSYTVSHDLRSPMRSVHGFSELLLEKYGTKLDAEAQGYLHRIQNAATRLDLLINDLLAFAKVSGSRVELRPIVLRDALARVLETSIHLASERVNISISACDEAVLAHETLLHQMLQNLLENASKFVSPGVKPDIRVWSEPRNDVIRLWVADNGVGIDAGDQERLFNLFERGDSKNFSGSGIGLAIVDRAAAKMNGRVGVESQRGHGSQFWIELARA